MLTIQKTKKQTPTSPVFCSECGWQGAAADVPYGRDPWDAEGGSLCYCPACGMVDDLNFPEGS
jgi:predicted RNA-binding Zn-ribbon protein involved in translation (DUF1610 family)